MLVLFRVSFSDASNAYGKIEFVTIGTPAICGGKISMRGGPRRRAYRCMLYLSMPTLNLACKCLTKDGLKPGQIHER